MSRATKQEKNHMFNRLMVNTLEFAAEVVGTRPDGGKIRKILSNVKFGGVEHKDKAANRGSGRPPGTIEILTDENGNHLGYQGLAPFFGPTQNEKQEQYGGATLAASGGYIKNAQKENELIEIGGEQCRMKWSLTVTAVPLSEIERRAEQMKATKAANAQAA
jgi:hypothetical protein